ncbi:hypothetical protein HAX54_010968 [Datura stramonium]|uniref:Uncharacterized protein n=1 Tax=Datura stramonium TaxID=4076 RepID=A0ABS8TJU0_DATST|nr:hypothetical protein [Datura stramonium]
MGESEQAQVEQEVQPIESKKWANLFTKNKFATKGMKLVYIAPVIVEGELPLGDICPVIGTTLPLLNIERISYVRMPIEMDITKILPKTIKLLDPTGKMVEQEVYCEWKPVYCATCL